MAEKNPFMKDYGHDLRSLKRDMGRVVTEVSKYLESRYGPDLRIKNSLYFLAILTCSWLKGMGIPLDRYLHILQEVHEEMR